MATPTHTRTCTGPHAAWRGAWRGAACGTRPTRPAGAARSPQESTAKSAAICLRKHQQTQKPACKMYRGKERREMKKEGRNFEEETEETSRAERAFSHSTSNEHTTHPTTPQSNTPLLTHRLSPFGHLRARRRACWRCAPDRNGRDADGRTRRRRWGAKAFAYGSLTSCYVPDLRRL